MAKSKITQKKAVFYLLWKAYRQDPEQYVPAWKFVGELYIEELGVHFFMSYKCPANGVNIYFDNPGLIARRETRGKSGSKYFEYKLEAPSVQKIKDGEIRAFYEQLKEGQRRMSLRPLVETV